MVPRTLPVNFNVYFSFFIYSVTLGAIFPRLGDLQLQMGVTEGALGLALIGAPVGAQFSLMFGGQFFERMGFRRVLLLGIPVLGISEVLVSTSSAPLGFFLFWMIGGLSIGALEIVVNLEADRVEYQMGRRIMNRSHAFWSFGFFTAGIIGAAISQWNVAITIHLAVMAVATTTTTFLVLRNYTPAPPRSLKEGKTPVFVRPTKGILVLVVFTLSAMLLEGAAFDWSVIFMRDTFATVPFISGMALAFGALAQSITRYFADAYVDRFGPTRVARVSIFTLGVGVVLVTLSPLPWVALLGFALMGIGNGVVFPLAMSAAAQRTDRPAATNVAALAQLSFITFLIAPPLLGIIAEHFGIRVSFGIGIPLVVLSWFTVSSLISKEGTGRG